MMEGGVRIIGTLQAMYSSERVKNHFVFISSNNIRVDKTLVHGCLGQILLNSYIFKIKKMKFPFFICSFTLVLENSSTEKS